MRDGGLHGQFVHRCRIFARCNKVVGGWGGGGMIRDLLDVCCVWKDGNWTWM